jgi:hypothetical protein
LNPEHWNFLSVDDTAYASQPRVVKIDDVSFSGRNVSLSCAIGSASKLSIVDVGRTLVRFIPAIR